MTEHLICRKCCGTKIKTRYHDGANYWGERRRCANGQAAHPTAWRQGPHLHYYCETCGWDWTGDCADS